LISSGIGSSTKLPNPTQNSIYTVCYTSGTTGDPKGVMLSHMNLLCLGTGLHWIGVSITEKDSYLSYLPLAHIMEWTIVQVLIMHGSRIGFYGGDVMKLKEDLQALKPTIFVSVPWLFNWFYDGMLAKINELKGMKASIAKKGLKAKLKWLEKTGDPTFPFYDKLVFNKFKQALGGKVRFMLTGSAPISKDVINFLKVAVGVPIFEGYGQTETCAGSTLTFSEDGEAGHVGGVLPFSELKLVDVPEMDYYSTDKPSPRGEICFWGFNCFQGYFWLPEKTAETIDEDGWVHTGDVGIILPNGALKIVDRKKNIFKLS